MILLEYDDVWLFEIIDKVYLYDMMISLKICG